MAQEHAILVVEDEPAIREGVCDILAYHGHRPRGVGTGEDGLREALSGSYSLVLLDVMLPGMNGFDVCRQIREQRPQQAVLMLTAKGNEGDILEGFRSGADDYVTKPFSVAQLAARIEALLRRAACEPAALVEPFAFGDWQIDPVSRTASNAHTHCELTVRELAMLALFHSERGRIVSRRRLLTDIWGIQPEADLQTRTVDMHIAKLRKKLAGTSSWIETVRGEGYRYPG